jgi:hypothetical protein
MALLAVPWNIATLLFAIAVFSLSYGMFPRKAAGQEAPAVASALEPLGDLFKLALLVVAIALPFMPWTDRYYPRSRDPHPHLHHAGLGDSMWWSASPGSSISAMWPSMRSGLFLRAARDKLFPAVVSDG